MRLLALLLVLANVGFAAWSQGWLGSWSSPAVLQAEPHRLTDQRQAQAVRVLTAPELALAERAEREAQDASRQRVCLQSPLLGESQANALRSVLERSYPNLAWSLDITQEPARWIIYMGKYANTTLLERKKTELRELGVPFEELRKADLQLGLSLGHYPSEAEARTALAGMAPRGIRSATVVLESEEIEGRVLRLPSVDEATRANLTALPELAGRSLQPC